MITFLRCMEHDDRRCSGRTGKVLFRLRRRRYVDGQTSLKPLKLKTWHDRRKSRIVTGIAELDRVLGGGIVLGSVI